MTTDVSMSYTELQPWRYYAQNELLHMQMLGPTTELHKRLETHARALESLATKGRQDEWLPFYQQAESNLQYAVRRDEIQAARQALYPGCRCLGAGQLVRGGYCGCPEGRQLEGAQRAEDWREDQVPAEYTSASLDSLATTSPRAERIVEQVRGWLTSEPRTWLLIRGPVGVGKTALALSVVLALLKAGYYKSAEYVTAPELMLRLQGTWGRRGDQPSEMEVIEQLQNVGVLLLDDLGKEKLDTTVQARFWQIINARSSEQRLTIITTNLQPTELRARLGVATADRIRLRTLAGPVPGAVVMDDGPNLRDLEIERWAARREVAP